jgi:hypothetical protein
VPQRPTAREGPELPAQDVRRPRVGLRDAARRHAQLLPAPRGGVHQHDDDPLVQGGRSKAPAKAPVRRGSIGFRNAPDRAAPHAAASSLQSQQYPLLRPSTNNPQTRRGPQTARRTKWRPGTPPRRCSTRSRCGGRWPTWRRSSTFRIPGRSRCAWARSTRSRTRGAPTCRTCLPPRCGRSTRASRCGGRGGAPGGCWPGPRPGLRARTALPGRERPPRRALCAPLVRAPPNPNPSLPSLLALPRPLARAARRSPRARRASTSTRPRGRACTTPLSASSPGPSSTSTSGPPACRCPW